MRWRQVLLVWVVFVALGAEYWFVERRREPRSESRPARPRFVPVRPGEVLEVRLSRGGRTVISRRGAEGWIVVEPADSAIPPDLVGAFANALTEAEEITRLAAAEADPQVLGFDAGATRVEVHPARGEAIVVTIGGANPTGTAVYARRQGATDVVLIVRNVRYYEDLIFQALSAERAPAADRNAPVGG